MGGAERYTVFEQGGKELFRNEVSIPVALKNKK